MPIELRNSDRLLAPEGFSHVSIAPPGPVVHLAGQIGTDGDGNFPDGLAAQVDQALSNMVDALAAADATPDDLAKVTIYVVGWRESMTGDLFEGIITAAARTPLPLVPTTLVGVESLFLDAALVEVEAVAVLSS